MGQFTDFLMGRSAEAEPASDPSMATFHHSSVLSDIILATQLQQGASALRSFQVPTVYRGIQILTDVSASMPWFAYDGGKHSGSRQVILPKRQDEKPTILVQPDPLNTRDDWVRKAVMSLALRGNAYLLGSMYVEGHPTRVQVLNPDDVIVQWADQARTIRDYSWGSDLELPRSRIRHLTLNLVPSALTGIGPIQAAAAVVAGQLSADAWARSLFDSSGTPSGKLMHPGKLSFDEADELGQQWDGAHVGTRRTAVLSGGMDFEVLSLTPDQAQFLQSRSFGVSELARVLGIPAHLMNAPAGVAGASGSSLTYTNVRDVWVELAQLTLKPVYLDRIAEAMSDFLPRGTSVQFDLSEFMRPDERTRFESYTMALSSGFLTVDEVRAREGLPPSPELAADQVRKQEISEAISGRNQAREDSQPESPATANA